MQQLDNVLWAISIHALREEGDMPILRACLVRCLFLSTPSARRATRAVMETAQAIKNFYPRPPRGGRLAYRLRAQMFLSISIHALREEGDEDAHGNYMTEQISIHALREEGDPVIPLKLCGLVEISIHALREEGDQVCHAGRSKQHNFYPRPPRGGRPGSLLRRYKHEYFYPRPPRGGRPASSAFWVAVEEFLSTPSARRATKNPLMVI